VAAGSNGTVPGVGPLATRRSALFTPSSCG
jgi:hypothetical protein